MKKFEYKIVEPMGIHARPAGMLVKTASVYESSITIEKNGKAANVKRIMALMSLGVRCDEIVTFRIEGADEENAMAELKAFCKEYL